jgi:hypothetical protein
MTKTTSTPRTRKVRRRSAGGKPAGGTELQRAGRRGNLKTGAGVVYPMGSQMQLSMDASVAGAQRVFDMERLAADPLFVHLAGSYHPILTRVAQSGTGGRRTPSHRDLHRSRPRRRRATHRHHRAHQRRGRLRADPVCVHVPGRLLRSGGRWELRLAPRPMVS